MQVLSIQRMPRRRWRWAEQEQSVLQKRWWLAQWENYCLQVIQTGLRQEPCGSSCYPIRMNYEVCPYSRVRMEVMTVEENA